MDMPIEGDNTLPTDISPEDLHRVLTAEDIAGNENCNLKNSLAKMSTNDLVRLRDEVILKIGNDFRANKVTQERSLVRKCVDCVLNPPPNYKKRIERLNEALGPIDAALADKQKELGKEQAAFGGETLLDVEPECDWKTTLTSLDDPED